MQTIALTVSYRGAVFSGFAKQPGQLTVQGELEHALATILRREVPTTCAGRTDTGVHARGQIVSFDITESELAELDSRDVKRERFSSFRRSINAIAHDDVCVRTIALKEPGFSARFDATAREYRYFLAIDETPSEFARDFSWHVGPVDVDAMHRASRCLIGEQDFKSFCRAASAVDKPTCRNVLSVDFSHTDLFGEQLLVVRIVGSSFLHSMVRTIVGTLVDVGRGRKPEHWVAEALAACDRTAAGECAPAQGLVFWEVRYDG